jgi:mannose-1-phosphate guanylyltransferase/mannose-1-phosphate guanylyltransferase/phosphomannomutase
MPKPMVPVLNRPVMEHILELLERHGFREVIANLHWFPDLIKAHFGDGSRLGVELSYSEEEELLGTAGGVRNAAGFLGDRFLVISADAVTDVDLGAMREFHGSHDGIATLATKRVQETQEFGVVVTGSDGRVQGFQEKPDPAEALSDLANCGIYMFDAEIFDYFLPEGETSKVAKPDDPPGFNDWATDVLPALLEGDVPFYSHEIDAYWNDIGNLEELRRSNLDAVCGEVDLDPVVPERFHGVRAGEGTDVSGIEVGPPVVLGAGIEIEDDVRIEGPVVIGDRAKIGRGSRIADSVLLPGVEVQPGAELAGEIVSPPVESRTS